MPQRNLFQVKEKKKWKAMTTMSSTIKFTQPTKSADSMMKEICRFQNKRNQFVLEQYIEDNRSMVIQSDESGARKWPSFIRIVQHNPGCVIIYVLEFRIAPHHQSELFGCK